jgi:hypothetical protein
VSQEIPAPTSTGARFDPFLGDDDLRAVYRALLAGRWDEFLERMEADASGWLASSIITSDDAAIETIVFRHLVDARPSAMALTLLAAAQARDAWELVAAHPALDTVPSPLRHRFESRMVEAESLLHEAVQIRTDLIEAWVHLLSTGRGLRQDPRELRTRFEHVHSRSPFRPDATRHYLLALGRRGAGNESAQLDFARWVEAEAPAAAPARMALPAAHLERGLADDPASSTRYLARPDTVIEIAKALTAYLEATPAVATPTELLPLNTFALAMTVEGRSTAALATECFRRIDNRPTSYPWSLYQEDIAAVFSEVQRTQLRSAARHL